MTDDDVIAEAYADGFTLEDRIASHTGAWGRGWISAATTTDGQRRAALERQY